MRIIIFGATGMVGSRIAAEAAGRGHEIIAVTRSGGTPGTPPDPAGVVAVAADASDRARVAELVRGADVVASALVPPRDGSEPSAPFLDLYRAFLAGVWDGGGPRTVIAGGAGAMQSAPGVRLVDDPAFPDAYKPEALAHGELLQALRDGDIPAPTWSYVSPAPELGPGERTGHFRLGVGDAVLPGAEKISAEDYAIAFVDELETGAHSGERISVAY